MTDQELYEVDTDDVEQTKTLITTRELQEQTPRFKKRVAFAVAIALVAAGALFLSTQKSHIQHSVNSDLSAEIIQAFGFAPLCPEAWNVKAGSYSCGARIEWVHNNMNMSIVMAGRQVASEYPQLCAACGQDGAEAAKSPICPESWETPACSEDHDGCYTCAERIMWLHNDGKKSALEAAGSVAAEFPSECGSCGQVPAATTCECDLTMAAQGICQKQGDDLPWCYVKPGCPVAETGKRGEMSYAPCTESTCFCLEGPGNNRQCSSDSHNAQWCYVRPGCPSAQEGTSGDWSEEPCYQDPSQQHFIQFDAITKVHVPRIDVNGLVREVVLRYPVGDGISVSADGTKVHFPSGSMLRAEYSRDTNVTGRADYGIQKAFWLKSNNGSMISDKVELMVLEKTHTMYSPFDDYPTHTKDRVEQEKANRHATENEKASQTSTLYARNLAVNSFVGLGMSGQVLDNSVHDFAHREAVREFVASNDHDLSDAEKAAANEAFEKFKTRKAQAEADPLRSSVACIHFETIEGMIFTEDGVDIPLDKKIVTFRGRISFSPNGEYDFTMGYSTFSYNEVENSIDIYFGFSHLLAIMDNEPTYTSTLWVAPPDGASWPRRPEGRPPSSSANHAAVALYAGIDVFPADYTFLYQNRQDVGCPDTALTALELASEQVLATLMSQSVDTMVHFTTTVPCGVEYLRPDAAGHSSAYGILESLGFMHFMMELPPGVVAKSLADHVDWNEVNGHEVHAPR